MAAVGLHIVEPADGFVRIGAGAVQFRGEITDLPSALTSTTLYYRWYSSLFAAEQDRYSMNAAALTSATATYDTALAVGTHVISWAASDQPGETSADFENTQHGGVTGGAEGETRCVIHIFEAAILAPSNGANVPRAAALLEAAAPAKWGAPIDGTDPTEYEPNDGYHDVNRLQYRWQFEPIGNPPGRNSAELIGTLTNLTFDIPQAPPRPPLVRFAGALPGALDAGQYRITLHVEDADGELGADQQSITVTLT